MRDIAAFHQEVIRAFGNAAAAGNAAADRKSVV